MIAFSLPTYVTDHMAWWIAGAIVVLGLLMYGLFDVLRFSLTRAWAISSVCFDDSIRRRVLWITPLAILGVVIVSQLQKPLDEQDAIRQTIKFCLFATGLVVVVTSIILACTSLPKDIETRVIYTVVTKPTTRLEIVVGKVIGFARVSAAILLIMGLFTFGYLHLKAYAMQRGIRERLAAGVDPVSRPTLEYWAGTGLLNSRTIVQPAELEILSRVPKPGDTRRWTFGAADESIAVPFEIPESELIPTDAPPDTPPAAGGVLLRMHVGFAHSRFGGTGPDRREIPFYIAAPGKESSTQPTTERAETAPDRAAITVQILDDTLSTLIPAEQINDGRPIVLTDASGKTPIGVYIKPDAAANLARARRFYVEITGMQQGLEYFVDIANLQDPMRQPVAIVVPSMDDLTGQVRPETADKRRVLAPPVDPAAPYRRMAPNFRSRAGTFGQQVRGGAPDQAPVVVFSFTSTGESPPIHATGGRVPFELRVGVERSGDEQEESATRLELVALNRVTNKMSDPIYVFPESNRTSYVSLPLEAVEGGKFQIYLRNLTPGNYIGVAGSSLQLIASEQNFAWNLVKSLLILWLLTILVVIIAIFCSTFLSWPIAIVLTLVLLLGHWAVVQLGEDTSPGIGNAIATDLGFRDPSVAKTVSRSVEALAKLLNLVSNVLPDISQFAAVEDIERGLTIPSQRLTAPLLVLLVFGLPMLVLSYVILRNKEVAP